MKTKIILISTLLAISSTALAAPLQNPEINSPAVTSASPTPTLAPAEQKGGISFAASIVEPNEINENQLSYEIKPGESKSEAIRVKNISKDNEIYIFLYPTELKPGTEGKNKTYLLPTDTLVNTGKWISSDIKEFNLQPGEEKIVNIIVTVPQNQEKQEYHDAGIAIESRKVKNFKKAENVMIDVNFRKVIGINVKVTDNPQLLKKKHLPSTFEIFVSKNGTALYFGFSALLFLGVILYYVIKAVKRRRHAKKHGTPAAEHHGAHHAEHKTEHHSDHSSKHHQ